MFIPSPLVYHHHLKIFYMPNTNRPYLTIFLDTTITHSLARRTLTCYPQDATVHLSACTVEDLLLHLRACFSSMKRRSAEFILPQKYFDFEDLDENGDVGLQVHSCHWEYRCSMHCVIRLKSSSIHYQGARGHGPPVGKFFKQQKSSKRKSRKVKPEDKLHCKCHHKISRHIVEAKDRSAHFHLVMYTNE